FENTLKFLSERLTFVSLDEFLKRLSTRGPSPRGLAALTFDDGFRNQYEVAYPILKRHQIPATFYVCSGLVESGAYIWTWEVCARLEQLSIDERKSIFKRPADLDIATILRSMKEQPLDDRESLQKEIASRTP